MYLSPHVQSRLDRIRDYFRRNLREENEVNPRFLKKFSDKNKLFPLKQIFIETLSAQLAVLPLLIYLFGRVSLISPLTNILILIAVPYSMALGFITGVLGFLWEPLARVAGWGSWILLEYKIRVIELFARVPLASVELGDWALWLVFFCYAFLLWKLASRKTTE